MDEIRIHSVNTMKTINFKIEASDAIDLLAFLACAVPAMIIQDPDALLRQSFINRVRNDLEKQIIGQTSLDEMKAAIAESKQKFM